MICKTGDHQMDRTEGEVGIITNRAGNHTVVSYSNLIVPRDL